MGAKTNGHRPSLGALALEIWDTDEDERGPIIERANKYFQIEVADAFGRPLPCRRDEFQRVYGRGRKCTIRWAEANMFYWCLRRAIELHEYQIEKERRFREALDERDGTDAWIEQEREQLKLDP